MLDGAGGHITIVQMNERVPSMILPGFWLHPCGLLLPSSVAEVTMDDREAIPRIVAASGTGTEHGLLAASRPALRSGIKVYATEEEIGLKRTSKEDLLRLLRSIPAEIGFVVASAVSRALWDISNVSMAQLNLASELFGPCKVLDGMGRFVAGGSDRVLFSEQALARLQTLLLLHGNDQTGRLLTNREMLNLKRCIVAVPGHLEHHPALEEPETVEEWLPYLTQNYAFNARDNLGSALGRNWKLFADLARNLPTDEFPVYCPLDEWLEKHTGLTIEDQLSLGFAIYAKLGIGTGENASNVVVPRDTLDDVGRRLGFDEAKRKAASELISAPRDWYRGEFSSAEADPLKASWNILPFLRRPFLQITEGHLLLTSPRSVETWLGDGIYYRLLDAASSRGQRALNDYTAYVGHLVERYAVELVESAHPKPRLPSAGVVHRERIYGENSKTSDIAVAYPHELLLLEVSSPRLTMGTRLDGRPEQVRIDLGKAVGDKLPQLGTVIEALKPGDETAARAELPGVDAPRLTTLRPIVVTAAPLHRSPPMEDYLATKAPEAFNRKDVGPLEILDLEDLETLVALAETGTSISETLRRKRAAVGTDDIRQWLSTDPTAPEPMRATYVTAGLTEAFKKTATLLGFGGPDLDEHLRSAG